MDPKLDAMLAQADQMARTDAKRAPDLFLQAAKAAFQGHYPDSDRCTVLLLLALGEWKAGHREQAQSTIVRLMVFCGRTGELGVFQALQQHASLEDCRRILMRHCPADAGVDETLLLLTGLEKMVPADSAGTQRTCRLPLGLHSGRSWVSRSACSSSCLTMSEESPTSS